MSESANVVEVFSSIQGEGLYVGYRQIFVRFFSCNLECAYCDTPRSLDEVRTCNIERTPGEGDFYNLPNPIDMKTLNGLVSSFETVPGLNHSISLTGGEPLLQAEFLKKWLPKLSQNFKIYLETNGTLYKELKDIIDYIDIISMDIKLPSAALIAPEWDSYRNFLKIARQADLFVKIVLSEETLDDDFLCALDMVADVDGNIPLILQPVTPYGCVEGKLSAERLLSFHSMARERLNDVRVIPQTHKMMELL